MFSKVLLNPELYEKYEISDLPIKAASVLNQISIYQKAKFTIDIGCKRYVSGTVPESLTEARKEFRDACIEFNAATSQIDIGSALSNVCMKAFRLNSGAIIPNEDAAIGIGYGMMSMVVRACSSFTVAQAVDRNGAINMELSSSSAAGWTTSEYIFLNYLPDNLKLLDEIAASDYFWPAFD